MRPLDAHGKLLTLLCVAFVTTSSLLLLSGCGGGLSPEKAQTASPFQTYDQVVEAFDQIVPNMTRADDLPNLGFDARGANADIVSYRTIQTRLPADPAVQACVQAELYCTGYVFHPAAANRVADLLGIERAEPADIILLVMNGRVIHKVFSARTPQARAPQDGSGAVARTSVNTTSF